MHRQELERMTREELVGQAEAIGIARPRALTQVELIDEIVARTTGEHDRARVRGWLGRARDLMAKVIERGLHLPTAVRSLRIGGASTPWPAPPPPLPTITLAEIYAAQGHLDRALTVIDQVLARDPTSQEAQALRVRLIAEVARAGAAVSTTGTHEVAASDATSAIDTESSSPSGGRQSGGEKGPEQATLRAGAPVSVPAPPVPAVASEPSTSPVPSPTEALIGSDGHHVTPVEAASVSAPTTAIGPTELKSPGGGPLTAHEAERGATPAAASTTPATESPASSAAPVVPVETAAVIAHEPAASEGKGVEVVASTSPVGGGALIAQGAEDEDSRGPGSQDDGFDDDEPSLPERYEVDEIVAIAVDPRTIYVYWEVRADSFARASSTHPEGFLDIRVGSVITGWEGPRVETQDLRVDALYGDRFVRDIQPGSTVRVSVGWKSSVGFEPFAVGAEVSAPRIVPVKATSLEVAKWEPAPARKPESPPPPPAPPPPPPSLSFSSPPPPPAPEPPAARSGSEEAPASAAIEEPHRAPVPPAEAAPPPHLPAFVSPQRALPPPPFSPDLDWPPPPPRLAEPVYNRSPETAAAIEEVLDEVFGDEGSDVLSEGSWLRFGGSSELSAGAPPRDRAHPVLRVRPAPTGPIVSPLLPGGPDVPPTYRGGGGDRAPSEEEGGSSELTRPDVVPSAAQDDRPRSPFGGASDLSRARPFGGASDLHRK